ncbi:hypothetical protein OZN62_00235 [Aurantiacibacter sp. MUD11]|uniref:hypothetical protein n=1 Tax=Aurantiacibacter sp. MUD11 TaxID=3003265 RepID=UPI0022AAD151|nr:hypothetical protein [Aurantiacibacter sp. MUD11]WAT18042.1 hypothetical protein OZN62_00235 [Aurantiacibacter sp. MUD11]
MPQKRLRALVLMRRLAQTAWRGFRKALNVSWLALRDRKVGLFPKLLGIVAALVGVAPIEWIPGINPLLLVGAELVLIPLLLAFAWWLVPKSVKLRLEEEARGRPVPWAFLALVAVIFVAAIAVDTWFDVTYPGQDAASRLLAPYLDRFE